MRKGRSSQLRKARFSEPGRVYLLTAVTDGRRQTFADLPAGRLVVRELMREDSLGLLGSLAYVVMPDHLHWLIQLRDGSSLSRSMQRVKSLAARQVNFHLGESGRVWLPGFHDRALRRDEQVIDAARYVIANPLRAGLVTSVGDYPLWDSVWV